MASDSGPVIFTIEAANALIPRLNLVVGEQMGRRAEIEARLKVLRELLGEVPDTITVDEKDSPEVSDVKRDLVGRIHDYQKAWKAVEEMGAVLKDARIGLIDFYGRVDGNLVWLCWKYGETEVRHYHALDEGFSARREIKTSMRLRLLN